MSTNKTTKKIVEPKFTEVKYFLQEQKMKTAMQKYIYPEVILKIFEIIASWYSMHVHVRGHTHTHRDTYTCTLSSRETDISSS